MVRAYRIHGRVQGVGFRWWARVQAERLGLRGTVRNERDGSVAIVAAGDEAALDSFLSLLEEGPSAARVDRITSLDPPAEGSQLPAGFEIIP